MASENYSTVSGGFSNNSDGDFSTINGGAENSIFGAFSDY